LRLSDLIAQHQPDVVICLGLAARRSAINLERVALNLDDAKIPDNAGDLAVGRPIQQDGPVAYLSTLPLEKMKQALQAREIPVEISNHAGAYVCNHVFYAARHAIEQAHFPAICGFIHVPAIADSADDQGLLLDQMIEAVGVCIITACRMIEPGQSERLYG
jgi:pyroglutamyl-peptidase